MAKYAKTLKQDIGNRFFKGEIGTILENDFDKYDYKVNFGEIEGVKLFDREITCQRTFYFYADELEILE